MSSSSRLESSAETIPEDRLARSQEHELEHGEDLSFFLLGTILLRNRWRIVRWTLLGGAVAAFLTWSKPPLYEGFASFIPQGSSSPAAGLSSIAGQFGLAVPASNTGESPDFYVQLLTSRNVLTPIVLDTFVVAELGGDSIALLDLFKIEGENARLREEQGLNTLRSIVKPTLDRASGTVQVSVITQWPSVSLAIVSALIEGVQEFNQNARQGQAAVERQFVAERLEIASRELRASEDRLTNFLSTYRQIEGSPQLLFERERLQREIALDQQVFTTLTQAHEEARIREVRAIPAITLLESPSFPALPEPRGRAASTVLGLLIGAFIGAVLAFIAEMMKRGRQSGRPDAYALDRTLQDIRRELFGWTRWFRRSPPHG